MDSGMTLQSSASSSETGLEFGPAHSLAGQLCRPSSLLASHLDLNAVGVAPVDRFDVLDGPAVAGEGEALKLQHRRVWREAQNLRVLDPGGGGLNGLATQGWLEALGA